MISDLVAIELLTAAQMMEADRLTIASGVLGIDLMERAGEAVAREAGEMLPDYGRVLVMCGPGNNGGDGYVAARLLVQSGYRVTLAALDPARRLKGDAALAADRWSGAIEDANAVSFDGYDLIVDALFGTGVRRPLEGAGAACVRAINQSGVPVLAVDGPSGHDLDDARPNGPQIEAARTVTFFRLKPGHVLQPGNPCGEVRLHQIGIPPRALQPLRRDGPQTTINRPALWQSVFPRSRLDGHKFERGHVMVVSGGASSTGAARLGARGALRIGAGLVTVASPPSALLVNASHLTAIMVEKFDGPDGLTVHLADRRKNAVLIGPGAGVTERTEANVLACLASHAHVVLDADALTCFAGRPEALRKAIAQKKMGSVVLTPHAGEYTRLFGEPHEGSLAHVRARAERIGCTIVAKGRTTIVASSDGRASISVDAPPTLATAGSGDVLAGFIAGVLAQGMPCFEGASAGVWLHGACAQAFGPGLIAEDLPEMLPSVLAARLQND